MGVPRSNFAGLLHKNRNKIIGFVAQYLGDKDAQEQPLVELTDPIV